MFFFEFSEFFGAFLGILGISGFFLVFWVFLGILGISGFFWVFWVFLGFSGFFWVFWVFLGISGGRGSRDWKSDYGGLAIQLDCCHQPCSAHQRPESCLLRPETR